MLTVSMSFFNEARNYLPVDPLVMSGE